ncbi:hypothetical protein [Propionivibrio sp.]|uniref:hypothetical protein n=1 Tax=Propionivibrio sp. TaxID=2212460 RepID=UPI003BF393A7
MDRHDSKIQFGRQAAVETQLFFTVKAALFKTAEIKKAEIDRFLDLVGKATGEQHIGNVRLQQRHLFYRMRIACRILQGMHQGRLVTNHMNLENQ